MGKTFTGKPRFLAGLLTAVLLMTAAFSGCSGGKMPQVTVNNSPQVDSYLETYAKPVELGKKLDASAFGRADARIFLAGEVTWLQPNFPAKQTLLQYLHEEQGVNFFLMDDGLATGVRMDNYIQNGDVKELKALMEQRHVCYKTSKEEFEFWKWLYEYNSQQPADQKIHVLGIGAESCVNSNMMVLAKTCYDWIDTSAQVPDEVKIWASNLGKDSKSASAVSAMQNFNSMLTKYPEETRLLFGENYDAMMWMWINVNQSFDYFKSTSDGQAGSAQKLDQLMVQNLDFMMKYLPEDAKMFGQFSSESVYLKNFASAKHDEAYDRFAAHINGEGSPLKGQVCSILYLLQHDTNKTPLTQDAYTWFKSEMFGNYMAQPTVIPLDGENSPFAPDSGDPDAAGLNEYFQKLMILPNAKSCKDYK